MRRFVSTLAGRKIDAQRGDAPHRGRILSWQIQGTVADILNAVCLKIVGLEAETRWRLLLPVHDAVYVAGIPEDADKIRKLMEAEAKALRLPLKVTVDTYRKGDHVRK